MEFLINVSILLPRAVRFWQSVFVDISKRTMTEAELMQYFASEVQRGITGVTAAYPEFERNHIEDMIYFSALLSLTDYADNPLSEEVNKQLTMIVIGHLTNDYEEGGYIELKKQIVTVTKLILDMAYVAELRSSLLPCLKEDAFAALMELMRYIHSNCQNSEYAEYTAVKLDQIATLRLLKLTASRS